MSSSVPSLVIVLPKLCITCISIFDPFFMLRNNCKLKATLMWRERRFWQGSTHFLKGKSCVNNDVDEANSESKLSVSEVMQVVLK